MRRLSIFSTTCSSAALRTMVWCANRRLARRPGQGLVEYGLILVLVMVVCVVILTTVRFRLLARYGTPSWFRHFSSAPGNC